MSVIVWHLEVEEDRAGVCQIEEQHKSPYVTALLTQSELSYGCISSELVPDAQQQVDVLLLNVSSWTADSADRQHESLAWSTSGHHRPHIYVTLKPSVVYGMLSFTVSL